MWQPNTYSLERSPTSALSNHVSTQDTIFKMCLLVNENLNAPNVQAAAQDILSKVTPNVDASGNALPSELDLVRGTFYWIKSHVQFVEDEATLQSQLGFSLQQLAQTQGKELLLAPEFILQLTNPCGDCDDFSTLYVTLLLQNGFIGKGIYFCTIAADRFEPDNFTHVYVKVVLSDGTIFPIDCSHGSYPGWQTNNIYLSKDWPVAGTSPIMMNQQTALANTSSAVSASSKASDALSYLLGLI